MMAGQQQEEHLVDVRLAGTRDLSGLVALTSETYIQSESGPAIVVTRYGGVPFLIDVLQEGSSPTYVH